MLLKDSRALVIGGSGALGPALVEELRNLGCLVTWTSRKDIESDPSHLRLDLISRVDIETALLSQDFDFIFNLAADFGADLDVSLNVNVLGLNNLLSACVAHGIKSKVVLIGSAAEYGYVAARKSPVSESQPLVPISVYGLTKVWQTQLAMHYSDRLSIVIARMFNLDAPNLKDSLFLGKLDKQIDEFRRGIISEIRTGPLDAVRDYVEVSLAAKQICAIGLLGEQAKAYHVASGVPVTMRTVLAERLSRGNIAQKSHVISATDGSSRSAQVSTIFADITRTTELVRRLYGEQ